PTTHRYTYSSPTRHPLHRSLHSFPTRRSSDLKALPLCRFEIASSILHPGTQPARAQRGHRRLCAASILSTGHRWDRIDAAQSRRSEEHTSELQSPDHLVCRLLLEKKKTT